MSNPMKRKEPAAGSTQGPHAKRSKGGNSGKWQTPQHEAKVAAAKLRTLNAGDMGMWVTCQRHKERQALDELITMCEEYGQKLYGIKSQDANDGDEEDEPEDIEAAIQKDIAALNSSNKPNKDSPFEPMRMGLDCLLFVRTRSPVNPIELVRAICNDAKGSDGWGQWRSRFINRFTPVTLTAKATEKGLVEVANKVLAEHFQLAGDESEQTPGVGDKAYTYAIRPTFRSHKSLKRDEVINRVASLIGPRHKVNLTTPDKVILIDIYQSICGMSVVDGDWDELKRYNIHELYVASSKVKKQQKEKEKVDNDERDKAEGRDGGAEDLKADIKDESPTKSDVKVEDEAAKVSKKNIEDTDVEMS